MDYLSDSFKRKTKNRQKQNSMRKVKVLELVPVSVDRAQTPGCLNHCMFLRPIIMDPPIFTVSNTAHLSVLHWVELSKLIPLEESNSILCFPYSLAFHSPPSIWCFQLKLFKLLIVDCGLNMSLRTSQYWETNYRGQSCLEQTKFRASMKLINVLFLFFGGGGSHHKVGWTLHSIRLNRMVNPCKWGIKSPDYGGFLVLAVSPTVLRPLPRLSGDL